MSDCSRCYRPIDGHVVRDTAEGQIDTYHPACRSELTVERAADRADRYIAQDLELAAVLCGIQRRVPVNATGPLGVSRGMLREIQRRVEAS